jgi:uncharacterized protein YaaQ
MDKELQDLLDGIKGGPNSGSKPPLNTVPQTLQTTISSLPPSMLTPDKLEDFILQNTSNIVQNGVSVIEDMKNAISQTIDPDEISALADIIKSTNGSLEILNKLNISNKKLSGRTGSGNILNSGNTNVFIGTREEAFKQILNNKSKKDINVEYTEIKEDDHVALNAVNPKEELIEDLVKEIKNETIKT